MPASTTSDLYSQLASKNYREIPRDLLKYFTAKIIKACFIVPYSSYSCMHGVIIATCRTLETLGSGEFGNVCKALWSISGTTKEVAVKTLKPGSSESDRVRFLQEAAIMGQFNHPYVVKFYGVVTMEDPVSLAFSHKI